MRTRRLFRPDFARRGGRGPAAIIRKAKIVAGATDVGVQLNKRVIDPDVFLDLNRVAELRGVEARKQRRPATCSIAGARATWTEIAAALPSRRCRSSTNRVGLRLAANSACRHDRRQHHQRLADRRFAAVFVRGGSGARIGERRRPPDSEHQRVLSRLQEVRSAAGRAAERECAFRCPCPANCCDCSKCRAGAISIFPRSPPRFACGSTANDCRAARRLRRGRADGAPAPQDRSNSCAASRSTKKRCAQAGDVAIGEITPISDVRGSADYRLPIGPECAAEVLSRASTGGRIIDVALVIDIRHLHAPCPTSANQFRTIRPSVM